MRINNQLLITLMAAHEMTMAELSRESGVSSKTIQLAVTNVQQSVSKETIVKIARALNVDPIRIEGGK